MTGRRCRKDKIFKYNFVAIFSLAATVAIADTQQGEQQTIVVKTESRSAFKELLYQVWVRLRALNT